MIKELIITHNTDKMSDGIKESINCSVQSLGLAVQEDIGSNEEQNIDIRKN